MVLISKTCYFLLEKGDEFNNFMKIDAKVTFLIDKKFNF